MRCRFSLDVENKYAERPFVLKGMSLDLIGRTATTGLYGIEQLKAPTTLLRLRVHPFEVPVGVHTVDVTVAAEMVRVTSWALMKLGCAFWP